MFPTTLIWALECYPTSCIEMTGSDPASIQKDFTELFTKAWETAYEDVEADCGVSRESNPDYYPRTAEESYPAQCQITGNTVTVILEPLLIPICFGEYYDIETAVEALTRTLDELRFKYSDVQIYGYIAFPWSDQKCGDVEMCAIGKKQDIYPKFGAILEAALEGEDLFGNIIEDPDSPCNFAEQVYDELAGNEDPEEFETMLDFLEKYDGILSDKAIDTLKDVIRRSADDVDDEDITELVEARI